MGVKRPNSSGSQVPEIKAEKETGKNDQPPLILNKFEELIYLCEDKRDLKTKSYLRRHVRLVEFRSGYFEFNQVGNPPREALQLVKRQIEEWTRLRWNIVISDKEGLPTFEELESAERDNQIEKARTHPAVVAILKAFEGARIVDVRIREQLVEALPPAPEDDEETTGFNEEPEVNRGLDDFYD